MPHKDPEKRKAYQKVYDKAWAKANRESKRASYRAWRVANLEKAREAEKARALVRSRADREKHSAKAAAWAKANPEKVKLIRQRRKARLLDACSPGVRPEEWQAICESYDYRCAYCFTEAKLTVDHIVPISKGGKDEPGNVVPACKSCNCSKQAKELKEWLDIPLLRVA